MTRRPRQIVIDKDAFIGINLDALCEFAKTYLLLLSDTLLYECATAEEQGPERRLAGCEGLFQ